MKNFLKSDWFKCLSCLIILAIVLCSTLAVLNDLLFVSPDERTQRALTKIYGQEVDFTTTLDVDNGDTAKTNQFGKIEKIYQVDTDLVFKAVGLNGYKGGTITLWIKVINSDNKFIIDKVILESYEKQTLMSKFNQPYFNNFLINVTDAYNLGNYIFSPVSDANGLKNPMTGATKSATAATNAVNCVIEYLLGGNA